MKIICLEGPDGSGKDTLIKQLIETYPDKFFTFGFPTPTFREIIKLWDEQMSDENIDHLVAYNSLFLADFLNYQEFLRKSNVYRKTLLLNRYFPSTLAYARYDFDKHTNDTEIWDQLRAVKYHPFLDTLVIPDITIYLERSFVKKEDNRYSHEALKKISSNYIEEMEKYRCHRQKANLSEFNFVGIPALNAYTFPNIVQVLKGLSVI